MIDLWTLLVVYLFQGFWIAVLAVSAIMWLVFVIGRVSQITALNFLVIFILSMAIGYGYILIAIGITIMIFVLNLITIPRLINS